MILSSAARATRSAATALGGLQTAFHALEAMRRQFSTENRGVRVVTLRTGGVPRRSRRSFAGGDAIAKSLDDATLSAVRRDLSTTSAASPRSSPPTDARTMTAATVNVSAGALLD